MTTVVHRNNRTVPFSDYVYIGRPSKWGNPFIIGQDGTREQVIQKYKDWITTGAGKHLLSRLNELKGKQLGCYCKPLPCHGDVLVELISSLDESPKSPPPSDVANKNTKT